MLTPLKRGCGGHASGPRPRGPVDPRKTGSQSPLWREGNIVFEETMRTLRKLEGTTGIPVPISHDEEGDFDRECPTKDCEFKFKVHLEDWKAKVRDEEVSCPFRGHTVDSTEWKTEEQPSCRTEHSSSRGMAASSPCAMRARSRITLSSLWRAVVCSTFRVQREWL